MFPSCLLFWLVRMLKEMTSRFGFTVNTDVTCDTNMCNKCLAITATAAV